MKLVFRAASSRRRRPAIFLDRDGVINERVVGGYVTHWTEFRFLDGIVPVLRTLSRLHLPIIVVSNQSGVSKGLVGSRSLRHITTRFVDWLASHGARIDAAYYCPHTAEQACPCRKPKPGLLLSAAQDCRIDLSRSVLIGDALTDVQAAVAAGCPGILLNAGSERILAFGHGSSLEEGSLRVPSDQPDIGPRARGWAIVEQVADLPAKVAAALNRVLP